MNAERDAAPGTEERSPQAYAPPPLRQSAGRMLAVLVLCIGIAYGAHLLMLWVTAESERLSPGMGRMVRGGLLVGLLVAYAVLIAVPFVPGIEIGISLLLMRGADVAPFVYLATVSGLVLAYLAGRALPYAWLHRLFLDLRLTRACRLLDAVQPLSPTERVALLRRHLPGRLGRIAVGYRYVLLALLINMPGSGLIGGGGGIAMVAGLTRLFSTGATLLTLALAVLPLPFAVWLWGPGLFD